LFLRNKVFTASATGVDYMKDIPVRCTSVFLIFCVSTDITRRCRFILRPLFPIRFHEVKAPQTFVKTREIQTKEGAKLQ
jgi:hypothetical protein